MEEHSIRDKTDEKEKDIEIKVCRNVIDYLQDEIKEKHISCKELEEAYKEIVLCHKKENEELKKELRIKKKLRFEKN